MTSHTNERLPMAITLGVFVALAQLGCLVALGFAAWGELNSPSTPFGNYPEVYSAVPFRGEVFFRVQDLRVNGNRDRIRAFNLKTGRVRDAITPTFLTTRGLVTDGQRLWAVGDRELLETDGTKTVTHRPTRLLNTFHGWAFLYEGRPAILDCDANDVERLLVFVDGDWQDKGQVAMPGSGRRWAVDEERGQTALVPRTSGNSTATTVGAWRYTKVVPAQGTYHLFHMQFSNSPSSAEFGGLLYRDGFDFVSASATIESVSALAPENAPADATGWARIETDYPPFLFGMGTLGDDALLLDVNGHVWKRVATSGKHRLPTFARTGEMPSSMPASAYSGTGLLASPDSSELYAIGMTQDFGFRVFRYDGATMKEMPYRVEGFAGWMVQFWLRLALKVMGLMSVGTLVLVAVGSRLVPRPADSTHSFGLRTVPLAPLGRRCVAKGVDVTLMFAPLVIHFAWLLSQTNSETLYSIVHHLHFQYRPEAAVELGRLLLPASCWVVTVFLAIIRYEGCYGVTPGKWLCGIRTLRTTLRPCGFARALLRELLMWFDTPLLLTILPGMMCMLSTEQRQRIGDLVADTIVVEHDPSTTGSSSSARPTAMSS